MVVTKYPYKTDPFEHQRNILNKTALMSNWAWFLEQGCGKTKIGIDNFAFLFMERRINGVVWIAPNNVHTNFTEEELPLHLPDSVPYEIVNWKSGRMGTIKAQSALSSLLSTEKLAILSINIEAVLSKEATKFLNPFLNRKRIFLNVDESSVISTPNAKTTKKVWLIGKRSPYRRIMNGTPARDGNPLDYFGQMALLDRKILGFQNYSSKIDSKTREITVMGYKDFVAEWTEFYLPNRELPVRVIKKDKNGFPMWKNLDVIAQRVATRSTRVTKKEVLSYLPDKLYAKRLFSLSSIARKHYNELLDEYMTEFDNGGIVFAERAAVRTLRFQQITCGYVGGVEGAEEPIAVLPGENPRLDAMATLILESGIRPTIVWARFQLDCTLILKRLADMGIHAVRYDGTVSQTQKLENINAYRDSKVPIIVANQKSMGKGHTLVNTEYMIYYSNYFDLEPRQHSEDRPHRPGLKHNVLITDLEAEDTVDRKIVNTLRNKHNVSDILTGDPRKDWI